LDFLESRAETLVRTAQSPSFVFGYQWVVRPRPRALNFPPDVCLCRYTSGHQTFLSTIYYSRRRGAYNIKRTFFQYSSRPRFEREQYLVSCIWVIFQPHAVNSHTFGPSVEQCSSYDCGRALAWLMSHHGNEHNMTLLSTGRIYICAPWPWDTS